VAGVCVGGLTRPVTTLDARVRQCVFWGMGQDGTVGATHAAVRILAKHSPLHVQVSSSRLSWRQCTE
jgi:hypothetical protein